MAILVIMPVIAIVPMAVIVSGASPERGVVNVFTLGAYGYLGPYILASASLPFFLCTVLRRSVRATNNRENSNVAH